MAAEALAGDADKSADMVGCGDVITLPGDTDRSTASEVREFFDRSERGIFLTD